MTVTVAQIETALGREPEDDEHAQWQMWIGDALLLIEARLGDPAELDQARLDYVVREAVVAHVRNPEDSTSVSWQLGDAGGSREYRRSSGSVTIRDEWWALLTPATDDGGAFVLDMASASTAHLAWCASSLGATYCSCGVDIAGWPIYELG